MACDNCGARGAQGPDDGGCYTKFCKDCDIEICNKCAGFWEDDASYEEGSYVWCGLALCKDCHQERKSRKANGILRTA